MLPLTFKVTSVRESLYYIDIELDSGDCGVEGHIVLKVLHVRNKRMTDDPKFEASDFPIGGEFIFLPAPKRKVREDGACPVCGGYWKRGATIPDPVVLSDQTKTYLEGVWRLSRIGNAQATRELTDICKRSISGEASASAQHEYLLSLIKEDYKLQNPSGTTNREAALEWAEIQPAYTLWDIQPNSERTGVVLYLDASNETNPVFVLEDLDGTLFGIQACIMNLSNHLGLRVKLTASADKVMTWEVIRDDTQRQVVTPHLHCNTCRIWVRPDSECNCCKPSNASQDCKLDHRAMP